MSRHRSLHSDRQRIGQTIASLVVGVLMLLAFVVSGLPATAAPPLAEKVGSVGFNRDIRAILIENCFTCHGQDRGKRVAGLRLDVREEALAHGAIVPGRPDKSKLIARIFATDGQVMPPVASHKRLTPAQKVLLRRWITEGAKYERHWAFVPPPTRVALPTVKNATWPRNAIDRFVLARLEREGLSPSPEADRSTWLRRVTLDLTGLPPTPKDVDVFLADRSPEAYGHVIDRLLASPHFGERMAVPWLDVARYADSYGYQSDQLCPTWPYRDWVVNAFNSNLSYDRFITWQLAGDLLPNATREQRLATAFNRLHRMTNEGGSVPEEWRIEGVADRVRTLGTAFLGLTLECARCHDHKYDPILQRNYYSFTAFFNSIDEHGLYDRADIVPSPSLLLPTPQQERDLAAAQTAVTQAETALMQRRMERETAFRAWLAQPQQAALSDLTGRFDFEETTGTTLKNSAPGATRDGARSEEIVSVEGHTGRGIEFDGDNGINFGDIGRFSRHTPFTISFWMRDPRQVTESAIVFQACSGTDTGPHGYDLMVEGGRLSARLYRHWPGNGIGVRTLQAIPKDAWTHVAVTYDGSSRAAGFQLYINGKPADVEVLRDKICKDTEQSTLVFGQRFRDRGFKGGRIDDLAIFTRNLTPLEVAQLADGHSLTDALTALQTPEHLTPNTQHPTPAVSAAPDRRLAELRDYYFSAIDPETRKAAAQLAAARQQVVAAETRQLDVAVMEEMPQPRPAYLLARGRYDAPTTEADRVERETPAAIFPFPNGLRRDRLGLAQWLIRPNNPLTARVAVNRFWAILFGKGIVETVEDFGIQGKPPTHPELLDWLARDFIGAGWNVKALVKEIVLSSTYRQTSTLRPDLRLRDLQNNLLARGPSHRLSAEAIRDTALAAAGLLDDRLGGPPVSPYQPGDLWTESNTMSPAYRQSVGKDLYRRSLYTVWKRTAPMPNMTSFDAPSREVCLARRQVTNTPLQALILLNDTQFVEAARALGERILKEGGATDAGRVRFAFRQLVAREPTHAELQLLTRFYEAQRTLFGGAPDEAAKLIHIGDSKPDATLSPAELAAATVVAQTVLNLDATVWTR